MKTCSRFPPDEGSKSCEGRLCPGSYPLIPTPRCKFWIPIGLIRGKRGEVGRWTYVGSRTKFKNSQALAGRMSMLGNCRSSAHSKRPYFCSRLLLLSYTHSFMHMLGPTIKHIQRSALAA